MRCLAFGAVFCVALLINCATVNGQSTATARPRPPTADAAGAAAGERIKAHVTFLADDLLEGRKAGTPGHEIAARYIAAQFALAGAAPGAAGSSYLHPIELHEVAGAGTPAQLVLTAPGGTRTFTHGEDALISGEFEGGTVTREGPLVFVGYGNEDSRLGLNDFAGIDVRGKIVVLLAGTPKGMDSEVAAHLSSKGGVAAARRGAIASIVIPTLALSRVFHWAVAQSVLRDQPLTTWVTRQGRPFSEVEREGAGAFVRQESAAALFEGTSRTLADILAEADTDGGRPKGFALPGTAKISVTTKVRRFKTPSVIAIIEGSDPVLRNECFVDERRARSGSDAGAGHLRAIGSLRTGEGGHSFGDARARHGQRSGAHDDDVSRDPLPQALR
jgi:hypothetical protein